MWSLRISYCKWFFVGDECVSLGLFLCFSRNLQSRDHDSFLTSSDRVSVSAFLAVFLHSGPLQSVVFVSGGDVSSSFCPVLNLFCRVAEMSIESDKWFGPSGLLPRAAG